MKKMLLGLATAMTVAALSAAAAPAQSVTDIRFGPRSGFKSHHGSGHGGFDRRDRRRDRHDDDGVVYFDNYREYQGDTAWKSDSFNDWWHDRPDRAYPRWMASNKNCERKWWGGGGWRC